MILDDNEIQAAYYAASAFARGRALNMRPIPAAVRALISRLDMAIRCPVSPTRQQNGCATEESSHEVIGSALAARILGWSQRRVQRHAADLDGRYLDSGRLVFDAAVVREYAEALKKNGLHDERTAA